MMDRKLKKMLRKYVNDERFVPFQMQMTGKIIESKDDTTLGDYLEGKHINDAFALNLQLINLISVICMDDADWDAAVSKLIYNIAFIHEKRDDMKLFKEEFLRNEVL